MLVKVFITRHIKEGTEREVFRLLKKIRVGAMDQKGYISGETLIHTDNHLKIIVLSVHDELVALNAMLAAGATGFVLKRTASSDLLPAVTAALDGRTFVSPDIQGSASDH